MYSSMEGSKIPQEEQYTAMKWEGVCAMDFSQSEYENLVVSLHAREEKILYVMKQMFEGICDETKPARAEKGLNEIYDAWSTLQETRQLKKRLQRMGGKGGQEGKAEPQNVRTLGQPSR